MLRRAHFLLWSFCWKFALFGWVAYGLLAIFAGRWALADRLVLAATGQMTAIGSHGRITRRIQIHREQHERLDRLVGASASVLRRGFREDGYGDRIPPGLQDDRTRLAGGEVVELMPRASAPARHRRSRLRRP